MPPAALGAGGNGPPTCPSNDAPIGPHLTFKCQPLLQDPTHAAYRAVASDGEAQAIAGWPQHPAGGASQQQLGSLAGEEEVAEAAAGAQGSYGDDEEIGSEEEGEGQEEDSEEEWQWQDAAEEVQEEGDSEGSQPQGSQPQGSGVQLLPLNLGSPRPKAPAPLDGPPAALRPLLSLRPAPALLRNMKHAAERRRGKLRRKERLPDWYLPHDECCSQLLGCACPPARGCPAPAASTSPPCSLLHLGRTLLPLAPGCASVPLCRLWRPVPPPSPPPRRAGAARPSGCRSPPTCPRTPWRRCAR